MPITIPKSTIPQREPASASYDKVNMTKTAKQRFKQLARASDMTMVDFFSYLAGQLEIK